jgi:hypothetical protein
VAAAAQTTNRSKIRETEEPALTYRRPMTEGVHLMTASKKGTSAHQLHRMLKVTYKTA